MGAFLILILCIFEAPTPGVVKGRIPLKTERSEVSRQDAGGVTASEASARGA